MSHAKPTGKPHTLHVHLPPPWRCPCYPTFLCMLTWPCCGDARVVSLPISYPALSHFISHPQCSRVFCFSPDTPSNPSDILIHHHHVPCSPLVVHARPPWAVGTNCRRVNFHLCFHTLPILGYSPLDEDSALAPREQKKVKTQKNKDRLW